MPLAAARRNARNTFPGAADGGPEGATIGSANPSSLDSESDGLPMSVDRLRTDDVERLLEAFASLNDPDAVFAFLQDVCTVREIQEMAQRLEVARMLAAGEHYDNIREATGASTTTISRVSRCLNYGADGYRSVLDPSREA